MSNSFTTQMMRIMRVTSFLLLVCSLHLSARTNSQSVTLSIKNAPIEQVFSLLKDQTGYLVFYKKDLIADAPPVTLDVKHMPLETFLETLLKKQGLKYTIIDRTIMVFKKKYDPDLTVPIFSADVYGQVKYNGKPIEGASVRLLPGNKGTATNDVGYFIFKNVAPGNYRLEITYVGYEKIVREITVGNSPVATEFSLKMSNEEYKEVVITTGYSTKKTGELTGAVQKISGDELRMGITSADPVSLLKGRATGLYISEQAAGDPTSPGGQIFVRGQSSIAGVGVDQYNEYVMPTLNYGPLLVLDGVIMPNQNLKDIVTPQEIDNITILKDAAATAIYGSRAAAGVLVVTTKRGKEGQSRMTAEVKYGWNSPNRGSAEFLDARGLYDLQKTYFTQDYQINNAGLIGKYPTLQSYLDFKLPTDADLKNVYDWQQYALINSHNKEANLSASGGNEKLKYYLGGGYYDEQSTGVQNGLQRGTFRINLESKLTNRLTAQLSINGLVNKGRKEQSNSSTFLYNLVPWASPYDDEGNLVYALSYKMNGSKRSDANPLFENTLNHYTLRSQLFFGSLRLEYKITDWLSISSTNSGNLNYTKNERYIDALSYEGSGTAFSSKGFLGTTSNYLNSFLSSNQLSFRKSLGEHSFSALAAIEYGETDAENMLVNVNNVRSGYPSISLARQIGGRYDYSIYGIPTTKAGNIEGGKQVSAVYSMFGEAGYTYQERYSLSASVRSDASSSFGRDNRYGTFFSGGAAWVMSSEKFMESLKGINHLKLRINYGTSGSQLGDNFLTKTLYDPSATYANQGAALISILENPDLRWEITKTWSGGVDFSIFKRINGNIDVYNRVSDDLLQKVTLPGLAGFPAQWQNAASVRNKGLEIMINSDNIVKKNFTWSTSFNISFNKNKILQVANDSLKQGFYTSDSYFMYKGEDINSLKAVKYAGVDPATGQPRFEKLLFDDKGNITGIDYVHTVEEVGAYYDQRQYQTIGTFQPKYYGGIANTFSYKKFTLSILMTYAMKYMIKDGLAEQMQGGNLTSYNQLKFRDQDVVWSKEGQTDATQPMIYYLVNSSYYGTDKYMHSGSHVRIRSVRFSYDLPSSALQKMRMGSCSFYISGDNLHTFYSKKLVSSDPEGPSVGQAQDYGESIGSQIAIPRRFIIGIQASF